MFSSNRILRLRRKIAGRVIQGIGGRLFGFRRVLIGNGLLTAVSLLACAFIWPATPVPVVVAIALRIAAILRHDSSGTPTIADFHLAFVLVSVVALIAVLDFLKLDPDAGAVVSGRQRSFYWQTSD